MLTKITDFVLGFFYQGEICKKPTGQNTAGSSLIYFTSHAIKRRVSQRIWTPPRFGSPGPNPLTDMDPPGPNPLADLDPLTKLSENIILNVLVKRDDNLHSSAYESMF